ncbi:MAG: glycoside hydrolase family 88 protein [Bacteroidota bacterium]
MAEPFYAEYADLVHDNAVFDDVANQFTWMEKHARDAKTGLLFHAWDESREQQWANKQTGTSPLFWVKGDGVVCNGISGCTGLVPGRSS